MKKAIEVSVIVPAYKQEKTIKEDIHNIDESMSNTRWGYEIIVIDDGSPDKTFQRAKELHGSKVKVFGYKSNKGKGYAIRYGMARSSGKYIAFIDGGMEIDPNGISMVLEHMEWYDADIIVGSKRHPVSKINYPFIRKLYSWGYSTLVRILFGLKVSDTQTGLKVYRREVLEEVLPRLLVKQFAFDIEILAVCNHLGFNKIFEAPINIEWDSEVTNFDRFLFLDKGIRDMIYDTLAVFYRLKILKYYDNESERKWEFDKELDLKINTGEFTRDGQ